MAGTRFLVNRVLACPRCDREKGPRTPQQWQPGRVWGNPVIDNPSPSRRPGFEPGCTTPASPAARRRHNRLVQRPFSTLRFCVTCQRDVDVMDHWASHLIIWDNTHEPG